ncbi:hypothetical protein [Leptolyngbya sp. PL-A3]|uniref:hypothetical protein n=1 Tax=Leptolyngbya sp. PL-A3 TaxID=2933911 RepID=UPI003298AC0D
MHKAVDVDEFLLWVSAQPPEARKAIGFVDYYLDLYLSPRAPQDEAYMSGWNEAEAIGVKAKDIPLPPPNLS